MQYFLQHKRKSKLILLLQEKIKIYPIITYEDEKNVKTVSENILFQAEQKVLANNHTQFIYPRNPV